MKIFYLLLLVISVFCHNVSAKDCYGYGRCSHEWAKHATVKDIKSLFEEGVTPSGYIYFGKSGGRVLKGGPILYFLSMLNPDVKVIKYFLKYAKKHNTTIPLAIYDKQGFLEYSVLHSAAWNKSLEVNQLFIELGADLSIEDNAGKTPLHVAAANNDNPEVIKLYLSHGSLINRPDGLGWTPLHYAARFNKNPKVVQALIDQGADISRKTDSGLTPYSIAEKYASIEIIDVFKREQKRKP